MSAEQVAIAAYSHSFAVQSGKNSSLIALVDFIRASLKPDWKYRLNSDLSVG